MKLKRWIAGMLCLSVLFCFISCDTGEAVQTDQTSETLSVSEKEKNENEAFLDTVSYLDYSLTGEEAPYFLGRWFEKKIGGVKHNVTLTDGSAFYFLIDGAESFDVHFTVITAKEVPYFAYSVDGAEPIRQRITQSKVVLPDSGKHTVRIIADGMTESEGKWQEERGFALKSVVPSEGGKLFGIRPENKVIFYYGDSITEGVRALNMSATGEGNSAVNAYPWFCSETLGAVTYSVGYGASGVTVPGSFSTFANAVDYLSCGRTVDDGAVPDVIVVNHGTNDRNASEDTFKAELTAALLRLREKYPDAPIVYMIPFVQSHAQSIEEVVRGFANAYVVRTDEWELTFTDIYHPDPAGARTAGENLAAELRRIFGEDFFKATP